MKQIHFFAIILFFNYGNLVAQTTNVVTGLDKPEALVLDGNDLYIAEYGSHKISKIDIAATSPTPTDVVTGLNRPRGIVLNGNDLYIAEFSGNKISKIDITATTPTPTDVVTGLSNPYTILLNGNDLYIAEFGAHKISKIDITATTPTPTDIVTGLVGSPRGMIIKENDLYIAKYDGNKITKFTLPTLSTNNYLADTHFKLYPNPSEDFIKISGLTRNENYTIYSALGTQITNGTISNNEEIDIRNLNNGLYFLKFDNGKTIKFLIK